MLIMLGIVLLAITGLGAFKFFQIKKAIAMGAMFAPPPAAVTTHVASKERWQPVISAVGSLRAIQGVNISTDSAGIVSEILFQSGAEVKKGDVLVKLDCKQEEARLRSAEARMELAKLNLERQRDLMAKEAVAQSAFDAAQSEFRQAAAAVDEAKALIARKTIVAPFDGLLGIRRVNLGQYLNVGDPIAQLESVDPITVVFAVPQAQFEQVAVGKKIRVKVEGISHGEFEGEIAAMESRLDEATRNVIVQGKIANPEKKLRAGMFAVVEVLLPEVDVIVIPAPAISYAPYGDSVYVVKDGKTPDGKPAKVVEQRFVKTGQRRGDWVAINSGVKEGDEVVSSGVFKLRAGAPVNVNNSVQPKFERNPNPPNN
jgi:membrane fusion protein (multidrug efflux system)